MFKNKKQAAQKLLERLKNDRVGERPVKIITLTSGGKPIADYLNKNLNYLPPSTNDNRPSTIIIADDGRASFSRLRGKINQLRQENTKKILVAMPIYEHKKVRELEKHADGVYILKQPKVFISAEDFYQE